MSSSPFIPFHKCFQQAFGMEAHLKFSVKASLSCIMFILFWLVNASKKGRAWRHLCPNSVQFLLGESNLLIRGSPSSLAHLEENRDGTLSKPQLCTDKTQGFATVTVPVWVPPKFLTCNLKVFTWVTAGNSSD